MKGLAQGEASSTTNPILQFFCRSGGQLADISTGTFKIEDITTTTPITRVPSTPLTASHKLSTGRYVIPTGSTASWSLGTHRVVCTYNLTAESPTFYQVIEFELLDATDWVTGNQYVGYASTKRLVGDGFVAATLSLATLHRHINRVSRQIEAWTRRFFEPRYLSYRAQANYGPLIHLQESIIAIDAITYIWQTTSGEDGTDYTADLYKVFNRHLDGLLSPDDRYNPKIFLIDGNWPSEYQGLLIKGVFGFTDPDAINNPSLRAGIGKTPEDLIQVVGALISRYLADPTLSSLVTQQPGAISSMKTRDQAVSFARSRGDSTSELTGDPMLDRLLFRFLPPVSVTSSSSKRTEIWIAEADEQYAGLAPTTD